MDQLAVLLLLAGSSLCSGLLFEDHVCYDGLGCFDNEKPFDNAYGDLPDSPAEIKVRSYLWTSKNADTPQQLDYQNEKSISSSEFDPQRSTKLLIHGYMSSKDASPVVANLSTAFLTQGDYNVIGVDWSTGAKTTYPKAVANTRVVGAVLAQLVSTLKEKFNMKLDSLHVIGHSLGAHIAGYVGSRVPGIARITGLDPAGPFFTNRDPAVRLDPTDALFVDGIHSDAVPLHDAGFGTMEALGHVDFYPNGGQFQPGCPPPISTTLEQLLVGEFEEAFDSVSCGHDRAIWYFIESVHSAGCQFTAFPCTSWSDFQAGRCSTCGQSGCPVMGLHANDTSSSQGTFYLLTGSQSPFCRT